MDSVFVGREAELEKAGELLKSARAGTESVLRLEGGPGIGKTAPTDKDIAASVNISPNTVGNHLRNIYAKTECASRGEAAHWALAHCAASVEPAESPGNCEARR